MVLDDERSNSAPEHPDVGENNSDVILCGVGSRVGSLCVVLALKCVVCICAWAANALSLQGEWLNACFLCEVFVVMFAWAVYLV